MSHLQRITKQALLNDSETNHYLNSLLNPWNGMPCRIPDDFVTPSVTKSTRTAFTYTVPGAGLQADIMIVSPFHSPYRQHRMYGKLSSETLWRFMRTIDQDEDIASDYTKARLVSAGLMATSATISAGAFTVNGTVNAASYLDPPRFITTTDSAILASAPNDWDALVTSPASVGVAATARPYSGGEYWTPIPYRSAAGEADPPPLTFDTENIFVTTSFNPGTINSNQSALTVSGAAIPNTFGWYKIRWRAEVTPTNSANGQFNIIIYGATRDPVTFANAFPSITIPFKGCWVDINVGYVVTYETWVYSPWEVDSIDVVYNGGASIVVNKSLFEVTSVSNASVMNLQNGAIAIFQGIASGQQLAFNGINNYEAVPNAALVRNVKANYNGYEDIFDLQIATWVMAHSPEFGIRSIMSASEFDRYASNVAIPLRSKNALNGLAASKGSVWARMWQGLKGFVRHAAAPVMSAIGTGLQAVTGLPLAELGKHVGMRISSSLDGGASSSNCDGFASDVNTPIPQRVRKVLDTKGCVVGHPTHTEQLVGYRTPKFMAHLTPVVAIHMFARANKMSLCDSLIKLADAYGYEVKRSGLDVYGGNYVSEWFTLEPEADLTDDPTLLELMGEEIRWRLSQENPEAYTPSNPDGFASSLKAADALRKAARKVIQVAEEPEPVANDDNIDVSDNGMIYREDRLNTVDPVALLLRARWTLGKQTYHDIFSRSTYDRTKGIASATRFLYILGSGEGVSFGTLVLSNKPLVIRKHAASEKKRQCTYRSVSNVYIDERLVETDADDHLAELLSHVSKAEPFYISFVPETWIRNVMGSSWHMAAIALVTGMPANGCYTGSYYALATGLLEKTAYALEQEVPIAILNGDPAEVKELLEISAAEGIDVYDMTESNGVEAAMVYLADDKDVSRLFVPMSITYREATTDISTKSEAQAVQSGAVKRKPSDAFDVNIKGVMTTLTAAELTDRMKRVVKEGKKLAKDWPHYNYQAALVAMGGSFEEWERRFNNNPVKGANQAGGVIGSFEKAKASLANSEASKQAPKAPGAKKQKMKQAKSFTAVLAERAKALKAKPSEDDEDSEDDYDEVEEYD